MPKSYVAGDQLPASEYNPIVAAAGVYALDAAGSDAYAGTFTPTPTTYAAGDSYKFKAGTANTGAATLNVNSLGAKNIMRYDSTGTLVALSTGDIIAGQVVVVVYDGTQFQMVSRIGSPGLGAWGSAIADGAGHQVSADGFLVVICDGSGSGPVTDVYSDSAATPTTLRGNVIQENGHDAQIMIPVRKGDYYKIVTTIGGATAYFVPLLV